MISLVENARDFAKKAHEGQYRWDGVTPYFTHPEAVAKAVEESNSLCGDLFRDQLIAAAYLHDVVEDSKTTIEDIERNFGPSVGLAVELLTHQEDQTYAEYIEELSFNGWAYLIKIEDIKHNLSTLEHSKRNKQRRDKYELALLFLENINSL